MKKPKVAISLEQSLLEQIDSKVDGNIIRSRSQAIEYFLRKGLKESSISAAVLLIRGEHQPISLKELKGKSLLKQQIEFFASNGIKTLYILTQHTSLTNKILLEIENSPIEVKLVQKDVKGNADALIGLRDKLKQNFVVMSGNTYNNFDLPGMIKKHLELDKLTTMGLISVDKPSKCGNAVLDGDLIIDFKEKPKSIVSNVVNAGIYVFKPEVFELFEDIHSLEKDLFSKLARIKQLVGFFTHGEYRHFG